MEIGFTASPQPVEEYFEFASVNGFRRLDLGCSSPMNFPQTFTEDRIRQVIQLRAGFDIKYGLHTASYVNTAEIMPRVRTAAEEHLLDYIRLSKQLLAEYCVIHCGYHFSLFRDRVMRSLFQTLQTAVDLAEELELPLVIENMNRVHQDCEIVYLGVTIDELQQVFQTVSSPFLGLALDVGHAHLLPGGVGPWIDTFPDKIFHLHLHDNDGILDQHLPVGQGTIDFVEVFTQLKRIGFTGTGTLEVASPQGKIESLKHLQVILDSL